MGNHFTFYIYVQYIFEQEKSKVRISKNDSFPIMDPLAPRILGLKWQGVCTWRPYSSYPYYWSHKSVWINQSRQKDRFNWPENAKKILLNFWYFLNVRQGRMSRQWGASKNLLQAPDMYKRLRFGSYSNHCRHQCKLGASFRDHTRTYIHKQNSILGIWVELSIKLNYF